MVSTSSPLARWLRMTKTGMRVPLMQGSPLQIPGLLTILDFVHCCFWGYAGHCLRVVFLCRGRTDPRFTFDPDPPNTGIYASGSNEYTAHRLICQWEDTNQHIRATEYQWEENQITRTSGLHFAHVIVPALMSSCPGILVSRFSDHLTSYLFILLVAMRSEACGKSSRASCTCGSLSAKIMYHSSSPHRILAISRFRAYWMYGLLFSK